MAATTQERVTPEQARAVMQAALNSPLPRFYANSFMNGSTESDVMTILQSNGQNICIVNLSYVTAKTLAVALADLVADYERRHKLTIPVMAQETQDASGEVRPTGRSGRRR